jgi:hypothetical protein
MLVGCVVNHEIDNDANAALRSSVSEFNKIAERAVGWIDTEII